MQGLITLDFGNSNPHAGLFQKLQEEWKLVEVAPLDNLSIVLAQNGMNAHNSSIVVSEVKPQIEIISRLQAEGFLVTRVKDYWRGEKFAGMPVNYSQTLGEDRLIAAFYCYKKFSFPTLIIDAGTFVTLDIVDHEGFRGGYILPGMKAYFSCFKHGEQLKEIDSSRKLKKSLPHDTQSAMTESYLAFGSLANELIRDYKVQKIVLTGGQSELWNEILDTVQEEPSFEIDPHLIHRALIFWMKTQIEVL